MFPRGKTTIRLWEVEQLASWVSFAETVCVVRSGETPVGDPRVRTWRLSKRIWITNLTAAIISAETIAIFGRERLRIDNEGFNELCNVWKAAPHFHHHPVSITGLWMMLFIAHVIFHRFLRNIKPSLRRGGCPFP